MIKQSSGAMNLAPKYFQQILSGEKTVEGRIAKEKFRHMQVGQPLIFVSEGRQIQTKIIDIRHFSSFKQYLQHYGLKKCLPDVHSLEEGVEVYHSFPGYKADEALLGVIGIEVKLMNNVDEGVL